MYDGTLRVSGDCDRIAREGADVIRCEISALEQLAESLGEDFANAITLLGGAKGRVVVSGMGKSGHIGCKIAATFASTGTPAFFVHPSEASHGDLGMITADDVCLLISNSGETAELRGMLAYIARFSIPMIAITRDANSTLARQAEIALILPEAPEACSIGMAPTTSTTCTLALGDALSVAVMRQKGFAKEDFQIFHPGGKLGAQFLRVCDVMHSGAALPRVASIQSMGEVLIEMTAKGFGFTGVVESGDRLVGVISDGDLRRNLSGLLERTAGETATADPKTATADMLLSEALAIMNGAKIYALPVVDNDGRFIGLVHMHDCLRAGVA